MGDGTNVEGLPCSVDPVLVGVLAVQGDFAEHRHHLEAASRSMDTWGGRATTVQVVEVRRPSDLDGLLGLVIPGGESTTMGHFLQRSDFNDKLQAWVKGNAGTSPVVWGTCAGLILLSNRLHDQKQGGQYTIGGIDITSCRNMYGRQQASFEASLTLHDKVLQEENSCSHGVFIRAPGIKSVDSRQVKILATLSHGDRTSVVGVEQANMFVTSFHPELTDDLRWHRYFLRKILFRK